MSLANEYYNKGVPMNPYAASVASSKIDSMLKSPEQLKSLVSGDFDNDGISFGDIEWDPNNIDGIRQQVKERVMQGVKAAAVEGKAYKDSKGGNDPSKTAKFKNAFDNGVKFAVSGSGADTQFMVPAPDAGKDKWRLVKYKDGQEVSVQEGITYSGWDEVDAATGYKRISK